MYTKRFEWVGHMGTKIIYKNVVVKTLPGKRSRGRLRQRWIDRVAKDIKAIDGSKNLENLEHREGWKSLIEATKCLKACKAKKKNLNQRKKNVLI